MLADSEPASAREQPGKLAIVAADLGAGITTGVLSLPQGIAFALIAGVPPQYGLYAMIVPTIVAAFVRSSPFLIAGSTNTSALVIGALLYTLPAARRDPIGVMLLITLLMGLAQVLAGVLRFGSIGRYVSKAVLIGFTFGAGLLIIAGQLKNVLGLSGATSVVLLDEVRNLIANASSADVRALAVAGLTLALVALCARVSRLVPGALIALAVSAAAVRALGWDAPAQPLATLGALPRELPLPTAPAFTLDLIDDTLGPSLALALLGMVEAISIGKAVSAKARLRFHPNQELVAQGLGNVAGAFFGCMPASASWTRSVVNLQMGARTRWVGVIAGLTVLAFMLGLAPLAQYVPTASLGALIIWIAWQMFDFAGARKVWRWSRKDAAVMLLTAGAVFVMEIQYAIYLGVIASLILLLHSAGRLHMVEMIETAEGRFREEEIGDQTGSNQIVLLQLEGDLFFGVVDELQERLERIAANGARAIIVRMKRTHGLDSTATEALSEFAADFKTRGGRVILCGLKPEMFAQIRRSDLETVLEPQNLLPAAATTFDSVHQALELARTHLKD